MTLQEELIKHIKEENLNLLPSDIQTDSYFLKKLLYWQNNYQEQMTFDDFQLKYRFCSECNKER